ncbi:CPBP family intramembrane glutamic endopeptidase [Parafrigoribacterium soli]|uniref:CPBP family intramembrane glutamic endopeptidase n=1 Tax=Parafrigoribacterium soli TaxID=3144663 RepID=UPI0032ED1957
MTTTTSARSRDTRPDAATPPGSRPGIGRRILAFPLVWAALGAAAIAIADGVLVGVGGDLGAPFLIGGSILGALLALGLYILTMRALAGRRVPELAGPVVRDVLLGLAIGAGFVTLSALIVAALGGYTITWNPSQQTATIATAVAVNFGAAVVEELIFRGLLLQAVERLAGPWVAIIVTALLFGGAHLLNPAASLWSSVAIAIEAGVLCGCAFVWRRSLWLVIALHFSWNVLESLLGIPVSGHREPGLWLTTVHGPAALTGGGFGLEASSVPVVVSLLLSAGLVFLARRRKSQLHS